MYEQKCFQATHSASLEEQILNSNFPKNEREWWACRHIKYLTNEVLVERNKDIEQLKAQLTNMQAQVARVERERDDRMSIGMALTLKATIRDLSEQLAAMTKERDSFVEAHAKVFCELAATEALLATYLAAIVGVLDFPIDDPVVVFNACKKALAIPSPQSALNNAIAEELERMAEQVHTYDDAEMIRRRSTELREMK